MKLLALIGTDYHLGQLPHFLRHYHRLGVDGFLCALHGKRIAEARRILADYPVEIVAEYGDASFRAVCAESWKATFNLIRRQYVRPDEWCLYADVDEFHEYPADFFAALDPQINAVMGRWVERLATSDGQLRACRPDGNLGEQFPFGTREIFCGISRKVMATRGGVDVVFGYHHLFGDAVIFSGLLNVHHFRWDDRAAEKYRDRRIARNDELNSGRVPDLRGVFAVDPPFPAAHDEPGPEAAPGPARRPARLAGEHPAVSCICLTYARPKVLEEAIHSFLQQDYVGPKELIVLNDYDGQILEFDHPEVLVVNLPKRLRTVGEKMNMAVSLAAHDLLFVWDDDDVYLPHRLTLSVAKLDARRGFFRPDKAWLWNSGTLRGPGKNLYHSGSCWTRRLFDEVGGYPADGTGYDWVFEKRLKQRFPDSITAYDIRPEDIYYIYRWIGTGSYHMSGYGAYAPGANVGHQQVETYVQRRAEQGGIQQGHIRLRPRWNDDYQRLVADCLHEKSRTAAISNGDSSQKLAYLIVAHHQPEHLARLLRAMDQENSHFFIHIDEKVAIEPFEAAVEAQSNVVFLSDRVNVRWGHLSGVLAELKLLEAATAWNPDFRYYTLLSGSDYPIKDRRQIHARLEASDREFIRVDRKLVGEPRNAHFRFIKRLPPGTYYRDLIPYHGCAYWSLTAACVRYILSFLDENPGFIDLHRDVFAPDEIFFHSIVKASPFAQAIVHDFERGTCADDLHHANHYIDWAGRRRRENLTLDERDLEDLLASEALFARKFHQERSRRLLDLIDDHVHGPGPKE